MRAVTDSRRLLAAATLVLLAGVAGSAYGQTDTETRLATVNTSITEIENWLAQARQQRSAAEQALSELNAHIDAINNNIIDNQVNIQTLNAELAALNEQEAALLADSEAQRTIVAQALRATYVSGDNSQLQLLLTQQDPATAQRMLVYFNAFNQDRLQQIQRFQQTLTKLVRTREKVTRTQEGLSRNNAELTSRRQQLEDRQQERSRLIASLNADMTQRRGELASLLEDRAHLQELLEEINRIIVDIPSPEDAAPFAGARGQLPWPLDGAPLARFGERYSGGNLQRQGIIIGADTGSIVRAVHNGRVVFADWLRGSGNLIVVDHSNGYISLYAHVAGFNKSAGDWVNRGEALATAGPDAGTGQPGLYFEIRQHSRPLDPDDWLRAR